MAGPSSFNSRQKPHLRIEPSSHKDKMSPRSAFTSDQDSMHTDLRPEPACSTLCTVLCMHDFRSSDPDHLSFSKHEILDIVKKEESGWWAAIRSEGDQIGWIPQAFVNTLSKEMADKLRNTRKELRGYEYNAEQLYASAPTATLYDGDRRTQASSKPKGHESSQSGSFSATDSPSQRMFRYRKPSREFHSSAPYVSPVSDKSTTYPMSSSDEDAPHHRNRTGIVTTQIAKRRPSNRLKTLHEAASFSGPSRTYDQEASRRHARSGRPVSLYEKREQTSGKSLASHLDELALDNEGQVLYGTIDSLIEKLTSDNSVLDPSKIEKHTMFRNTFLMTFRTFMTAEALFQRLVDIYHKQPLDDLTPNVTEWRTRHAITQRCVLMIFTMWLEDHRLLGEEPHLAKLLTDFLRTIVTPPLASLARLLTKSIQRLTFTSPPNPAITAVIGTPRKPKKSKGNKNDLTKLDAVDVAEQLTLFEFQRYIKVTPQECLRHAMGKKNSGHFHSFCSTHDKLVFWVKVSILENDPLGKRADTIDFWIKVAEKCKGLNNFASMSAIITALSSAVISRLYLTWAYVGRKSTYESLSRYNDPIGNFSAYRNLMRDVEGSCIPFVIMFLTELVHIHEQFTDEGGRLCFFKRQRWYETVTSMLRYQSRPYEIAECVGTMGFITKHLRDLEEGWKEHNWFWTRSHEVQQTEKAHADIRKGLEAAGF